MNIAIFVDGNSTIGLGHVYISKELSNEFITRGHKVKFIVPIVQAF